ncbi:HNH endonuclease [Nakamurella flava]|uniref:HNH endonuclease n=1 Tax=Nakamurella flava TaxID=2576308 RepID=A0A4U6QMF0_9ACTN|nr:HNH endonuclease [Nakamurella flava]TKV61847.1 HNH endonuclease [Nakamurella flava]
MLIVARDTRCVFGRCDGAIEEVHHRLPRGMGGAGRDETRWSYSRLVGLCAVHHRWVELNRRRAYELGLLVRHGRAACSLVPVLHHGRWVLLDDGGCVLPCEAPAGWSE